MRKYATTYAEHLARYAFAMHYCYKKRVLDVGCGDGSGSSLLAYTCNSLDLADISPKMLNAAKGKNYDVPNIRINKPKFFLCDFEKEFPEGSWDTIVAFEVIEHLENPDFFIKNIAEHLNKDGLLVFSVPHMVVDSQHKTLFDEVKIRELISKYLTLREFYTQDRNCISGRPMYAGLRCYIGVAVKK